MRSDKNNHLPQFGYRTTSSNKIHSSNQSFGGRFPIYTSRNTQNYSGISPNLESTKTTTQYRDDTALPLSTNFQKAINDNSYISCEQQMKYQHPSSTPNTQYNASSIEPNQNLVQNENFSTGQRNTQSYSNDLANEFQAIGLNMPSEVNNTKEMNHSEKFHVPSAYSSNNAIYSPTKPMNTIHTMNGEEPNYNRNIISAHTTTVNRSSNRSSDRGPPTYFSKHPYSAGNSPVRGSKYQLSDNDNLDFNQSKYRYQHWGLGSDCNNEPSSAASYTYPSTTAVNANNNVKAAPPHIITNSKIDNVHNINDYGKNASVSGGDYTYEHNYNENESIDPFSAQSYNVKHHTTSATMLNDNNINGSINYGYTNSNTNTPTQLINTTAPFDNYSNTPNFGYNHNLNQNQNMSSLSTPDIYHINSYQPINQGYMGDNTLMNDSDFIVNIADIKMLNVPEFPPEVNSVGQPSPNNQYTVPNIDHISLSLNAIPPNNKELKKYGLPFGLVYTPLKKMENIPLIYPKEITRCAKCLCYLNPFTQWTEPLTFACVFCGRRRSLTADNCVDLMNGGGGESNSNYQQLSTPILMSYTQSPMLQVCMTNSTYEIVAPASFCKYPPKTPTYIVLMDMTAKCISTGYLEIMLECLSANILTMCPNKRCSIAFVGYNQFVHYFSMKTITSNESSTIKTIHHVFSDISAMHQPSENELFNYPGKNLENFQNFLKTLPKAIRSFVPASTNDRGKSCMTNALKFCMTLLEKTGGKIILFNGTPPNIGEGVPSPPQIKYDSQGEILSTLPTASSTFYKSISLSAYKKSICLDFFYFGFETYSPLVEMITMVGNCGGTYKYFSLTEKSSQLQFPNKFKSELDFHWSSDFAIDNLIALRTSRGIEVESYYGNVMLESYGKMITPFVNENSTLAIKLELDDVPFVFNGYTYVQMALFHTCPNGERRIRVTTLPIKVLQKNSPLAVFSGVNQFTVISLIARFIQFRVQSNTKLTDVQEATLNSCKQIVSQFYEAIKTKFDGRNLLMHSNMKHLLCFVHSLVNHPSISPITTCMGIDSRLSFFEFVKTCTVRDLIERLYPKLYSLNNLEYSTTLDELINTSDPNKLIYPLHPSAQFMYQQCAYLLEAGNSTFILIPKGISTNFLKSVFNCDSFDDLPHFTVGLPSYPNQLSSNLHQFVNYIVNKNKTRSRPSFNTVIFKVDANSICSFYNYLPFDRRPNKLSSLNEFYSSIKESILSKYS